MGCGEYDYGREGEDTTRVEGGGGVLVMIIQVLAVNRSDGRKWKDGTRSEGSEKFAGLRLDFWCLDD